MQLPITPFSQHEPAQTAELPASLRMISLFYGMFAGQAICTAVTYNLAGFIETHGALTATELAERSGTHAFSLYRLLRALASIGIFQPVNPQEENVLLIRFAQTDLSQTLVPDAAGSVYEAVRWLSADVSLRSWGALTHSIATGEPGLRKYTSQEFWKYLQEHPTDQVIFQEVMTWMTKQARDSILPFYDFSSFEHLVDVAGGRGTLLYSILGTYPHLVGTLFDQVEVIEM